MAFITDYILLHDAGTGDFTASGFSEPELNNSASTTPIFIEDVSCLSWPLKKGTTDGYAYVDVTGNMSGKLLVAWLNYPFADIQNIPITELFIQASSDTGLVTSNWAAWDALAQITSPYNTPISGHTPIMAYSTNPDESSGTIVYTSIDSIGWRATTGSNADGKQGGFDMFFIISWIGEHSETFTDTFFDDLYEESYDSDGGGLPGTSDRPLGIISRSGDFFQTNVKIQFGHGTSDTANLVVSETGKTIFFSNVEPEHELGYVFVNPNSTYENRLTLIDCVHFWTSQQSTHEIFTDVTYATYFKITGCAFTNGGKISLPSDSVNRWVRSTKFSNCQSGTASNGEFTDNILQTCLAMTISGDADFRDTQILAPAVAADTSGLIWNGNYDPDGNLDGMIFTKGTNAHHAIEFGTASPLTMTLRNISVSGFNASNAQNDSVLHIKRTSGTVTINLLGCTGTFSYKSAGATVIVQSTVDLTVTVKDTDGLPIENVQTAIYSPGTGTSGRIELMNEDTNASGIATESYGGTTPQQVEVRCRKASSGATKYKNFSSIQTISTSGLSLAVTMEEDPNNNAIT